MKRSSRENIKGLSIVVPTVIYYAIFTLVPLVMLFCYAFTDYSIIRNTNNFIWFDNFKAIFTVPEYFSSLLSTLIIAVSVVVLGMVLGFILAVSLNKVAFGKGLLRTLWYAPGLVSSAVISTMINVFLQPDGTLNQIFYKLGFGYIDWYSSVFWMYFFVIFIVSWQGLGGTALYFIAGLNGIDKSMYEAASIDGCAGIKRLFYIDLPLIRPMLGYILITGFIGAFNIFEPILLITQGKPDGQTKVILYRIYDQAFVNGNLGFASALSVVVYFIVLILTFFNMRFTDKSLIKPPKEG